MDSKTIMGTPKLSLPPFPFYWRIKKDNASHPTIPEELPYTFSLEPSLGLVIEERNDYLLDVLHLMYQQDANIGFLQDGHTLATAYGDDFFSVIREMVSTFSVTNALEVGCGGCYLLERVKDLSIDVLGVDPSPIAQQKSVEKGLSVINEFYPAKSLQKTFDLIYHVDVLEHVENPVTFLKNHLDNLNPNGLLIVNVPDNSRTIELGDISLATHQHLNSFDELSLFNCFEQAGFKVIDIIKSKYGGSLYGVATPTGSYHTSYYRPSFSELWANAFFSKASDNISRFSELISKYKARGTELGFYMPLRTFPYLSAAGITEEVRLFDDISHWHNSYIGSSPVAVENFTDLCHRPVDHLFIMSHSFGHSLRRQILSQLPSQQITLLSDFLAENNNR